MTTNDTEVGWQEFLEKRLTPEAASALGLADAQSGALYAGAVSVDGLSGFENFQREDFQRSEDYQVEDEEGASVTVNEAATLVEAVSPDSSRSPVWLGGVRYVFLHGAEDSATGFRYAVVAKGEIRVYLVLADGYIVIAGSDSDRATDKTAALTVALELGTSLVAESN
ncbi:hypothetical protein [Streptomyces sp. NPDC059957]|uniref:hypothetical protein n=1 Tax=unclassified Streptomyces TaxID=2593676 RepID=UPI00365DB110